MFLILAVLANVVFSSEYKIPPFVHAVQLCKNFMQIADEVKELPFINNPSKVLSCEEIDLYFTNNLTKISPFMGQFRALNNLIIEPTLLTIHERNYLDRQLMRVRSRLTSIDQYLYINKIILQQRHIAQCQLVSTAKKIIESLKLVADQISITNQDIINACVVTIQTRK